ncbi:MAG: hypothetical protein R2764_08870 [Bacteroidales bacterium]
MKGAEINLTNTENFGNIINYQNAGNYEFNSISEINGNDIVLLNRILNEYDVEFSVQIIKVPIYENLTVNNTISCEFWNGSIGGVCAIEVVGSIILNEDINVSGKGFRGAQTENQYSAYGSISYFYHLSESQGARKGEGIFKAELDSQYECGKGSTANGGGGGNGHNRGGGVALIIQMAG